MGTSERDHTGPADVAETSVPPRPLGEIERELHLSKAANREARRKDLINDLGDAALRMEFLGNDIEHLGVLCEMGATWDTCGGFESIDLFPDVEARDALLWAAASMARVLADRAESEAGIARANRSDK